MIDDEKIEALKRQCKFIGKDVPLFIAGIAENSIDKFLLRDLIVTQTFFSGSKIHGLYHGIHHKQSDIDLFVKTDTVFVALSSMFDKASIPYTRNDSYGGGEFSCITLTFDHFPKVQFINLQNTAEYKKRFNGLIDFNAPHYFVQGFDFMHTCAVYDFNEDKLIIPQLTLHCIENNLLQINPRIVQYVKAIEQRLLYQWNQIDTPNYIDKMFRRYLKFIDRGFTPTEFTLKFINETKDNYEKRIKI